MTDDSGCATLLQYLSCEELQGGFSEPPSLRPCYRDMLTLEPRLPRRQGVATRRVALPGLHSSK